MNSGSYDEIILMQNYPNPFEEITNIPFSLPEETNVKLSITNFRNELIKVLFEGKLPGGEHTFQWDSKKYNNKDVDEGNYSVKLEAAEISFVAIRRITKK